MNTAFAGQVTGDGDVAFFLSDGDGSLSTGPGTYLQAAADAGTVVNTYSVGGGASGCGHDGYGNPTTNLQRIADTTGGTCTEVADPADLSGALVGTIPAGIASVSIQIDGSGWSDVTGSLDAFGNFAGVFPAAAMTAGTHTLEARVIADDADVTTVTADITVMAVLPNEPPVAECADIEVAVDDTREATVTVIDDTPPTVTLAGDYESWLPNHEYVAFDLDDCVVAITDNCDAGLTAATDGYVVEIYSDEEEDAAGKGDGITTDDIVIYDAFSYDLRAERQGGMNGRVYGITLAVEDLSGNVWQDAMCTVSVPHDQAGAAAVDDGPLYVVTAP